MYITNLNENIWANLRSDGDSASGYYGEYLRGDSAPARRLLIFLDEDHRLHLVIAVDSVDKLKIINPKVNGLKIGIKKYRFHDSAAQQFIDLECGLAGFAGEFTEIVREISALILVDKTDPEIAVNRTVATWQAFWGAEKKQLMTDEEQIGLYCELIVLQRLCRINAASALQAWKGPLKEKHDFQFTEWSFEVKATRRDRHMHVISGIDQLDPLAGKHLALISFLISLSDNQKAVSLSGLIRTIEYGVLADQFDLVPMFNELLNKYGYNRSRQKEYDKNRYMTYGPKLFIVDKSFPKLTPDNLKQSLDGRVSDVRYTVDLQGLNGTDFNELNLGLYFY